MVKVGGAGLFVGSVRELRWASAMLSVSPSKVDVESVFLVCFLCVIVSMSFHHSFDPNLFSFSLPIWL